MAFQITKAISSHFVNRCVIQLRGALNAQLLDKSLKLTLKDAEGVAAVSLMSADVEAVLDGVRSVHSTWSGMLDLAVGFYLIATVVKQSAFLGAMPSLCKCMLFSRGFQFVAYPVSCIPGYNSNRYKTGVRKKDLQQIPAD